MNITAIVSSASQRAFYAVDALVSSLGSALSIAIPVIEGALADAPASGYLLVFSLRGDDDRRYGPRIVAFNEHRGTIMKTAEEFQLAAAVESHRYFEWKSRPAEDRGYGLVGRKDVAARMSARIVGGPYTSPNYGLLASESASNLVELLAAYLTTYAQSHPSS